MIEFNFSVWKITMDSEGAYRVILDVPSSDAPAMLELQGRTQQALKAKVE